MPQPAKMALWVVGGLIVLAVILSFFRGGDDDPTVSFAEVLAEARAGNVERIEVRGTHLEIGPAGGGGEYDSRIGDDTDLLDELRQEGVEIGGAEGVDVRFRDSNLGNWLGLFINFRPAVVILGGMYFIVRNAIREGIRQGRA